MNTTVELVKVEKDIFFKIIYDRELNVHPTPTGEYPYISIWKFLDSGELFGKSMPLNSYNNDCHYYVGKKFVEEMA